MSVDHVYYLGIKNKDTQKIKLAGPYNKTGEVLPVLSRGSMSSLWKELYCVEPEYLEEDAKKEFTWENYLGEEVLEDVRYIELDYDASCPLLTKYIYKEALMSYIRDNRDYYEEDELDQYCMSEEEYAVFCNAYLQNKKTCRKIDPEYSDETIKAIPSDYILYRWKDFSSPQYEAWIISETAENLGLAYDHKENEEIVILGVRR